MNSDEEDDLLFNRNRAGWKTVRLAPEEPHGVDLPSGESDGEPAKKKRKVMSSKGKLPDWTRGFNDSSDDSESKSPKMPSKKGKETENEVPTSPSAKRGIKGKRTKQKSLPRALTPPPELDPGQLEAALNIVSYALFPKHRSLDTQEGVIDLEDNKSIDMEDAEPEDAELAKILEESRAAAAKKVEQERLLRTSSQQGVGEQETKIKIRVFWEPPPGARAKWAFAFTFTAPFRRLFETITQKVEGVRMQDIVLLYEGKRLYPGGSPKAAHMRTDKTSEIRACHLSTWMTKMAERVSLPYPPYPPSTSHGSSGQEVLRITAPESASREASVALEGEDAEIIKLFLRCRARPDPLRLNVRTSAKCTRVIDAYLKKLAKEGIVPQSREEVRVVLDGEEVDDNATFESLGLEDGDQVDVSGV